MTVAAQTPAVEYFEDGATVVFPVPFRYKAQGDLRAERRFADGSITQLAAGSGFTASDGDSDSGGTLTVASAAASGAVLAIWRETARAQPTDYITTGAFPADSHEGALDRAMLVDQEQDREIARAPKVARGETAPALDLAGIEDGDLLEYRDGTLQRFDAAQFAGRYYAGAAGTGQPIPASGTGGGDAALRFDLATRAGQDMIGTGSAPGIITPLADILDHVSGASYFGIPESGSSAGETAQARIEELSALALDKGIDKGAVLRLKPYTDYDWEVGESSIYKEGIKLRPGVVLDLQGARMTRRCHSDVERGFILMSRAGLINGRIDAVSEFVSVGGSSLGSSAGIHGCIGVGSIYGEGGTPAVRSELDGQHGMVMANLTLTADKWLDVGPAMIGGALIQLYGDCHSGLIHNIEAPSSARAFIMVAADWNFASANLFESGAAANYATYRNQWTDGTLRTYHPYNWAINTLNAQDFTAPVDGDLPNDTGSFMVRLSGCQAMQVANVRGGTFTNALVALFAGDPGFEYATTAARNLGMDGSTFHNVNGLAPQHGYLGLFESYADNLADAILDHGYDAFTNPLIFARLIVDGLRGFTDRGALAQDGIRALRLNGADIKNSVAIGFKNNFIADERSRSVKFHDGKGSLAQESDVYIGHGAFPPEKCEVSGMELSLAGRGGGGGHHIFIGNHRNTKVFENTCGVEGAFDDTTSSNIRVDGGSGLEGWGNRHHSTSAAGAAESILLSDDFDGIDRWEIGEMLDPDFINIAYGGASILPTKRITDPDGVRRGLFRVERAAMGSDVNPPGGTWEAGQEFEYRAPGPGGFRGFICVASGTNDPLAGVTGSISSGSNLLTVNSSAALKVGQYITIAGVTGSKKITGIDGASVLIDSNADATVAGAAVAYSAALMKTVSPVSA